MAMTRVGNPRGAPTTVVGMAFLLARVMHIHPAPAPHRLHVHELAGDPVAQGHARRGGDAGGGMERAKVTMAGGYGPVSFARLLLCAEPRSGALSRSPHAIGPPSWRGAR